jgi:hypothetical protein
VRGADILEAAEACHRLLVTEVASNWNLRVPSLDWTVAQTVAHAATGPLWYALDVWSGGSDDAAFDVSVKSDASNAALLVSLMNAARLCAASVDAAPADTRGFHPAGSPDPSGFAAMACDELLVHTYDAASGLKLTFRPNLGLAERVLARLFPWHEGSENPWQMLLWIQGRTDLPGRSHQDHWKWHCAPLEEWSGNRPSAV